MKRTELIIATSAMVCGLCSMWGKSSGEPVQLAPKTSLEMQEETDTSHLDSTTSSMASTVEEARGRARILHETLHGVLQVMHRDFFDKDETRKIPSRSLKDVFSELSESHAINAHWIAVDTKAMSVENEAETDFEKAAVKALRSGQDEFERVSDGKYEFAGKIRLSPICLGCHAPSRTSNDDRFAGLVIEMHVRPEN
ncbi:MAG: DUF3365 domain-containing protein [Pirellulaceae bacterium]